MRDAYDGLREWRRSAGAIKVPLRGADLMTNPALNKDTAFTAEERASFGLQGLLPAHIAPIERQVGLEIERLRRKPDDLEKYIGLTALQNRNEILFYRVLAEHLQELAPIIYTPTVGRACQELSHVMRRPRGIWITPDDVHRVPELLRNSGHADVRLIVVTDNERILGLGDLGAGGMGIPIGKLALYTAGAGIHPAVTLPVSLDVGTDNAELLADPYYVGWPHPRLRGAAYDAVVEAFVEAVREVFPQAVVQWEDFKQHNAMAILRRYRHRVTSFNDDIQGTAGVTLAAILSALRMLGRRLAGERILFLGAGAAGLGIASLVREAARRDGGEATILMMDSRGLVHEGRDGAGDEKVAFALGAGQLSALGLDPARDRDLEAVVRAARPTILVGTTGTAGSFTEPAVRAMAAGVEAPIVLPLSNPTALSEATPAQVLEWTGGRAIVATGSPFDSVAIGGMTRVISQANNAYVFPGVGLGAIVAEAREITEDMFLVAARTLAGLVSDERLSTGALFPPLSDLRAVSRAIAAGVVREARDSGFGRDLPDGEVEPAVEAAMWWPEYEAYEPA